jgi:hypothetical protein
VRCSLPCRAPLAPRAQPTRRAPPRRYAHLLAHGASQRVRHDLPQSLSARLESDLTLPIQLWLQAYRDAKVVYHCWP